jgi:hypothetical protein
MLVESHSTQSYTREKLHLTRHLWLFPLQLCSFLERGGYHLDHFCLFRGSRRHLHVLLEGRWLLRKREMVLSKTMNVLAHIRRQCSYCLLVSFSPFLIQLFSNLADGVTVGANETSGHEVMKFTTRVLLRTPNFTDCQKEQSKLDNDDGYHYNT